MNHSNNENLRGIRGESDISITGFERILPWCLADVSFSAKSTDFTDPRSLLLRVTKVSLFFDKIIFSLPFSSRVVIDSCSPI